MREALKNAVQSAILFECQLPHQESGLGKSCLSSQNDICFNNTDPQEIAKVKINGSAALDNFLCPCCMVVKRAQVDKTLAPSNDYVCYL